MGTVLSNATIRCSPGILKRHFRFIMNSDSHSECEAELVSKGLTLGLVSQENGNIYANIMSKKVTREKDL